MEKFFILFFLMFVFAACGTKTVEIGNPDFPDSSAVADDDTAFSDSDTDSLIDPDSDSAIDPDDDTNMPDNDSTIHPDDDTAFDPDDDSTVIPDEDSVTECTVGERKCDDSLDNVLECNAVHAWVSVEDCSAPLKMCVESPADNFFCDDLVCEPGVKFCKNEDLYTCNTDGKGDTLAQNCTDTQYCNAVSLTCEDMVCEPSDIYCDGSQLKKCNMNGSSFEVLDDCSTDSGSCDGLLDGCLYTGDTGGETITPGDRTGSRGNVFLCEKDVTVVEFLQGLNFTGSKNLTWAIYEAVGSSINYTKIFSKTEAVTGSGEKDYSSGIINVNLKSGNKYLFFIMWEGQLGFFFGSSSIHPKEMGFGESIKGYTGTFVNSLPNQIANPDNSSWIFKQIIKFK